MTEPTTEKPVAAPPVWDGVPGSLAVRQQWLLWCYEWDPKREVWLKVPYYVSGGRRNGEVGTDRDRMKLTVLSRARQAYERDPKKWAGVGFAFLPDDGLIGIDLDDAVDLESGVPTTRCAAIIQACNSFTETSTSGTGVHIIVEGKTDTNKSNDIGLEIFCSKQYFIFTGNRWPNAPAEVAPIEASALARLHTTVNKAKEAAKTAKQAAKAAANPPASAPPPAAQPSNGGGGAADFPRVNEAAMANFLPWVPELFPQAIKHNGGYRVTSKALGRNLQEDLAIDPRGIMDWGVDDIDPKGGGRTPIDLVMEWLPAPKPADALRWLASRLGVTLTPPPGRPQKVIRANVPAPAGGAVGSGDGGGFAEPPEDVAAQLDALNGRLVRHRGRPMDCRENVLYCLTLDPDLKGMVIKNDFVGLLERSRETPWGRPPDEWDEEDDLMLGEHLLFKHGLAVKSKSTLRDGVMMAARLHKYNPIQDLIRAEKWDGVDRLDHWLADVFEVDQRPYTALIGRCFFMGLVKRAMEPGCKFDYMLILKGEQGLKKSSVWRSIAYPWFTDNAIRIGDKDSQMAQQLAWVVESAELESLNKSESTQIKQHLSAQEDWFRPPYGSQMVKAPRHSVHVGTTNADSFLRDATGDRRFWPLEVFVVNLERLESLRAQLLAEALVRVQRGERYWPDKEEERTLIFPEQEPFKKGDAWDAYLDEYVNADFGATATDIPRKKRDFFPTTELFDKALMMKPDRVDGAGNMDTRMSNSMKSLGFKRTREPDGKRRRGFIRLVSVEAPQLPKAVPSAEPSVWVEPDHDLPF